MAVDCNFIMLQVPNMPLSMKRQRGPAVFFFFPPGKQTFHSVLNCVVHVTAEHEDAGLVVTRHSGIKSGEG